MSDHASPAVPQDDRRTVPLASWWALAVLSMINLFGYMDRMALAILVEPIKAEFGASDQQMGLLVGLAFTLFYSTLGIPIARLADRISRLKLLSACLFVWSAMTMVSGLTKNFPQLFLARAGVGIGEAGCTPPAHSLIADYFPRSRRSLAITIFQTGAAIGGAVGMFTVGLLAQELGWRASLQVIGAAGIPLALLALLTLREPARPQLAKTEQESAWQAIGALARRPAYVHLVIAYALATICNAGVTQWYPAFMMRSFGMTMAEVGGWIGLSSLAGSGLGLLSGGVLATWLAPRDSRWELWIPAIAFSLCVPVLAMSFLSPSPLPALLAKTLGIYLSALASGVALAAIQSFAEPHRRATAVAIFLFFSSMLGSGVGAYVIGLTSDLLMPYAGKESLRYALLASCAMAAWSILHFYLSSRRSLIDRVN